MISIASISSAIPGLPNAVIENVIFPNLSLPELVVCSRVCKTWREMAKKQIKAFSHEKAFGPKEWYTYFGAYLKNVPRLPFKIEQILNSPCPFCPDKKVHETHVLVLVPETVNGQPLTLKTLGDLVMKPLQGNATKYDYFALGEYADSPSTPSHWVLLTRDVIEGSRNKTCKQDHAFLDQYIKKTTIIYEIPTVLDAAVCNFLEYVRCGNWLHGQNPSTFTWCQEKCNGIWNLVVGGGSGSGLYVTYCNGAGEDYGVGGLRKF